MITIDMIKDALNNRTKKSIKNGNSLYEHSAVLIPLFQDNGNLKVLFTKRSNLVQHHKGQISFPGGGVEEKDKSLEGTALRESREEIGLQDKDIKILGRVDDSYLAVSNYIIHPYVGLIPYPYKFRINEIEVARLLFVPLEIFLPDNMDNSHELEDFTYHGPTYHFNGDTIWGATARIMENFIEIICDKINGTRICRD
ncbi:NUDIX hydrolase [Thermodesulfobacteriota bacterium]